MVCSKCVSELDTLIFLNKNPPRDLLFHSTAPYFILQFKSPYVELFSNRLVLISTKPLDKVTEGSFDDHQALEMCCFIRTMMCRSENFFCLQIGGLDPGLGNCHFILLSLMPLMHLSNQMVVDVDERASDMAKHGPFQLTQLVWESPGSCTCSWLFYKCVSFSPKPILAQEDIHLVCYCFFFLVCMKSAFQRFAHAFITSGDVTLSQFHVMDKHCI